MVMSSILSNASEAIDGSGSIQITCRNEDITEEKAKALTGVKPGSYVSLIIRDDGRGMDKETIGRVFDPFFTTKFHGRGLGMAAAYGIIKNHHGFITIDSELGKGTTVSIYLSAVVTAVEEEEKKTLELSKGTGTVLVIEDEAMLMDLTSQLLEKLGYKVLRAQTGREAVSIANSFEGDIDIALLDIILPDMVGTEIYPLIKEIRPNIKVLVCSGYSIDGPAQEILDAGAHCFIQKPISISDLSQKLQELLDKE
jgi:CheY-like chemotaxis protein